MDEKQLSRNRLKGNEESNLEEFFSKPDLHNAWIKSYRNELNEKYFELAFDKILSLSNISPDALILDAGCGSANHSIRLAKRGFSIVGVDFSESAIEIGANIILKENLESRIKVYKDDITNLNFLDNSFDVIFCWGVLMHVPEIELAIKELARVLKPSGMIIISENNANSLECNLRRIFDRHFKNNVVSNETELGFENWYKNKNSVLLVRHIKVNSLIKKFENFEIHKKYKISGQFTEAFVYFNNIYIKRFIHLINNFWFNYINISSLSCSNIIILQKKYCGK